MTSSAFGVEGVSKKLSDPQGNAFQRPTHKNTRGQNATVGATVGGAEYGAIGAAVGAKTGGVSARRSMYEGGAHRPKSAKIRAVKLQRAGIRASHTGKGAAIGTAIGAGLGGAVGAISAHNRGRKKLPMGRVSKSAFGVEL